jgi:hypothetical protein
MLPGATTVAESGIFNVALEALLVIAIFPLEEPAVVGASVTVNVTVCPAIKVRGAVKPVMLYPVPLAAALEIVTLALPEFVTVSESDWLLPVWTLPKFRLAVCAVSAPVGVAVAVAESVKLNELLGAVLVIASAPVDAPVVWGA